DSWRISCVLLTKITLIANNPYFKYEIIQTKGRPSQVSLCLLSYIAALKIRAGLVLFRALQFFVCFLSRFVKIGRVTWGHRRVTGGFLGGTLEEGFSIGCCTFGSSPTLRGFSSGLAFNDRHILVQVNLVEGIIQFCHLRV